MRDDTPDDLVHDLFAGALFPEHPLGREVLGSETSITDDGARRHRRVPRARTTSRRTSCSPRPATSTHDAVLELRRRAVPGADGARPDRAPRRTPARRNRVVVAAPRHRTGARRRRRARARRRSIPTATRSRSSTRCSAAACRRGCSRRSARRAGSRTRCSRTTRAFDDTGYARDLRGHRARARARDARGRSTPSSTGSSPTGLTDAEIAAAKGHLVGSLAMSLETSASRMRRLGRVGAGRGRDPEPRRARRPRRGGHRRRRRPGRSTASSPDAPRTLAVVGPHATTPSEFATRAGVARLAGA